MDKARMTFRLNEDRRKPNRTTPPHVIPLREDEFAVQEEAKLEAPLQASESGNNSMGPVLNHFTASPETSWNSPFDAEADRIEQLIRQSDAVIHPETGYYDPGDRDPRYSEIYSRGRRDKRSSSGPGAGGPVLRPTGGSLLKLMTSIAGAVVTGVAFGFFVLNMFSGGGAEGGQTVSPGSQTITAQGANSGAPVNVNAESGGQSAAPVTAGQGQAAVSIPHKSYKLMQGGVFSTEQSALTAQADFHKLGMAAVWDASVRYPVYIGMTLNQDEAAALKQHLQQQQIDVMVKNAEVPALAVVKWNGESAEVLETYMAEGTRLVQLMTALTLKHVMEEVPTSLDERTLQAVKTSHQAWLASASAVAEGLGGAGKEAQPQMNSALNTAVRSLEEYKKNPSTSFMWQAQTALMQYVLAEQDFVRDVSGQQ